MLFLVLRILCAPTAVLVGTVAQRRFGHAVGGLVVGLPLLFLPFLWLIAYDYGVNFARAMTGSLLIATSAEVALMWTFAFLASRFSATCSTVGALAAFVLVAGVLKTVHVSLVVGAVLGVLSLTLALVLWPRTTSRTTRASVVGKARLGLRLVVSTLFTVVLISFAGRLGASLSGIVDAIPLTSLMMAFFTRHESNAESSSLFLRGVTRGSFSYVVAMFVLVETWRTGNELAAFGLSLGAALVVQLAVQSGDSLSSLLHSLKSERLNRKVASRVQRRVPGATTFKKFYESISA
ncbi:MAG: hypothetical protein WAN30_07685 [Acidimicrobiales bacterium]